MPPRDVFADDLTHFGEILKLLVAAEVEFIVVGGIAGVLAGTGLFTQDLDILFAVNDENIAKLLPVLEELDAVYVDPMKRTFRPTEERLRTHRLNLFETRIGRLDVLPKLSDHWTYADLLPRSLVYRLGELTFRALSVDALIETKEAAGRPKDQFALLHLRRIQELQSQPKQLDLALELYEAVDDPSDSEP